VSWKQLLFSDLAFTVLSGAQWQLITITTESSALSGGRQGGSLVQGSARSIGSAELNRIAKLHSHRGAQQGRMVSKVMH
jgi:hypothetical protein